MQEYNYHPEYKYYLNSSKSFESPEELGSYLVSAYATLIEPPLVQNGKVQIFDERNNTWIIVDDLRGAYYNIFNGKSFYNENPLIRPEYSTNVEPPLDYNPNHYIWNSQHNTWQKLDSIYKVVESELSSLTITEKLKKLNISPQELRTVLNLDDICNSHDTSILNIEQKLEKVKEDLESLKDVLKINEIFNAPIAEKFNILNIKLEELNEFLGINQIIRSPLQDKFNLLNIDIEEFKNILGYQEIIRCLNECKSDEGLLQLQFQHFKQKFNDTLSSVPSQYIAPVNFSEIAILRPQEIINTSIKFETDNSVLPAISIGICCDTGKRKFGDGVLVWNDLPYVLNNQRYRFSRTLERWQSENPIPGENIECYETDTGKIKIGNGILSWDKLPYEEG